MRLSRIKNKTPMLAAAACLLLAPAIAFADAEQDWQKIIALDAAPKATVQNAEQAQQLALQAIAQQEKALRVFIATYPNGEHSFEAHLRLAHLLVIRGDLQSRPEAYSEAERIYDTLEKQPSTPREKLSAVAYARITMFMHRAPNPDSATRENLVAYVRKFQRNYPQDHRAAALLAEMATLYDTQPKKKRELLEEALAIADKESLKQRINDDLRRLSMLGKPLALKFDSVQGAPVDVAACRGKVVLVYFFAGWSRPSAQGLAEVKRIAGLFSEKKLQIIGVSLDNTREALIAALGKLGVNWPVAFDGKGWEGELVRSLGINALPTAWLLDRNGNLRTLNALDSTEAAIRALIEEK
jgi:tetratricopeptide (TPR) repeat protein